MRCDSCDKKINPRTDVRYTTAGRELCSPKCVIHAWIAIGGKKR